MTAAWIALAFCACAGTYLCGYLAGKRDGYHAGMSRYAAGLDSLKGMLK